MIETKLSWEQLKSRSIQKGLYLQYIDENIKTYKIFFIEDCILMYCLVFKTDPRNDDQIDFEDNFKASCNSSPIKEIITQFEKNDKTLKLISNKTAVNNSSEAVIEIKVPGIFSGFDPSANGRFIDSGEAWFSEIHNDDKIEYVRIIDKDDILGYGAGTILREYSDSESGIFEGWYIPKHRGVAKVDALGGYGFIPSELYLVIKGKKGESITTGTFYINIKWGKLE